MNLILIACGCVLLLVLSALLIALTIVVLDGTDFMDAIVERIRREK